MRRTLFLTFLLAALAGCADPEAPVEEAQAGPDVITRPDDVDALQNGTGEHIHDYWNGQDRLLVVDKAVSMGCGACQSTILFRPDALDVVPLGTASIEVEVSWTEQVPGHYDPMRFLLKTAADNEAQDMGEIGNGETLVFPVTTLQADLPHQVLSAWEFQILLSGTPLATFTGTFDVKATAVRGLDIPPFPPHPDHWQGETEIPLFEGAQTVAQIALAESATIGNAFTTFRPDDGVLVPQGTGLVRVVVENAATVPSLGLRYHGGDTWAWTEAEPVAEAGGTRTYEIEVGPLAADGPYAQQSLWEFVVFPDAPLPAKAYAGTYSLAATAIKA